MGASVYVVWWLWLYRLGREVFPYESREAGVVGWGRTPHKQLPPRGWGVEGATSQGGMTGIRILYTERQLVSKTTGLCKVLTMYEMYDACPALVSVPLWLSPVFQGNSFC